MPGCLYYILTILAINVLIGCNTRPKLVLREVKVLSYPSASGVLYFNEKIYIIGDDAPYLLILDEHLNLSDSIPLINSTEKRIPKNIKPDLESIALVYENKRAYLMALGSGSLDPYRNAGVILDLKTHRATYINLDSFYYRIKVAGINDLNVEGAAAIPGGIIIATRGNKTFSKNHLVFTTKDFWKNQDSSEIKIIKTGVNQDTSVFNGISGMDYSAKSDKLILTVSTEDTYSTLADGKIGTSYLWIINDITSKKSFAAINPNIIIDLEKEDPRFVGHKIESVCISHETKTQIELIMVSDDDRGGSGLFRVVINK